MKWVRWPRSRLAICGAAAVGAQLWQGSVRAHDASTGELPAWRVDWLLLSCFALVSLLYTLGHLRRSRQAQPGHVPHRREAWAFALCMLSLVVALISPLDRAADLTFSAHMTQHELLMVLAAPLLVLARPLDTYFWILPARARRAFWTGRSGRWLLDGLGVATRPLLAVLLHGAVRWLWHVPWLFEAALRDARIHALQHASFFLSAALFWWGIVHGRYGRAGYGAAALFVMFTAVHTGGLGALLALGDSAWYPLHAGRSRALALDPVGDQQVAGLIMWVGAGVWFMFVALGLFLAWLGEARLRSARGAVAALLQTQTRSEARSVVP